MYWPLLFKTVLSLAPVNPPVSEMVMVKERSTAGFFPENAPCFSEQCTSKMQPKTKIKYRLFLIECFDGIEHCHHVFNRRVGLDVVYSVKNKAPSLYKDFTMF